MQPIDSPRRRGGPSKEQKARQEFAADAAINAACKDTGRERPAWMQDKALLPRSPPTRTGRP